jgi:hypothetical protein
MSSVENKASESNYPKQLRILVLSWCHHLSGHNQIRKKVSRITNIIKDSNIKMTRLLNIFFYTEYTESHCRILSCIFLTIKHNEQKTKDLKPGHLKSLIIRTLVIYLHKKKASSAGCGELKGQILGLPS